MLDIDPIQSRLHLKVLSAEQLADIKAGTLYILETVGVRFPSQRALNVFAEHGAQVNREKKIICLSPDLVTEAVRGAPRSYTLSGRVPGTELVLDGSNSYFGNDGCESRGAFPGSETHPQTYQTEMDSRIEPSR